MLIIDRFEGNMAVIEYENSTFNVPRSLLPENAREGDVLDIDIKVNKEETEQRRRKVKKMMDDLFK